VKEAERSMQSKLASVRVADRGIFSESLRDFWRQARKREEKLRSSRSFKSSKFRKEPVKMAKASHAHQPVIMSYEILQEKVKNDWLVELWWT